MSTLTLTVAVLCLLSGTPVWSIIVTLANDSTVTALPCYTTTLPFQLPETIADNALIYGDDDDVDDDAGLISQLDIDEHIVVNRTSSMATARSSSWADVGLLPGLLATLQRRIRASLRSTGSTAQQQQQPASSRQQTQQQQTTPTSGKERSLLPRLTDVLARYGLRLPTSVSSQQTNDLCSHDNADRMKRKPLNRLVCSCWLTLP